MHWCKMKQATLGMESIKKSEDSAVASLEHNSAGGDACRSENITAVF